MKIEKFLACRNEMASNNFYVYHSRIPRYLAKVERKKGQREFTIEIIDQIDEPGPKFEKELNLCQKWVKAYFINQKPKLDAT